MPTGRQMREARILLGLTQSRLAEKTRVVTTTTLKRVEAGEVGPRVADAHVRAVCRTLERLGIEFVSGDDSGPGVKLRSGEP